MSPDPGNLGCGSRWGGGFQADAGTTRGHLELASEIKNLMWATRPQRSVCLEHGSLMLGRECGNGVSGYREYREGFCWGCVLHAPALPTHQSPGRWMKRGTDTCQHTSSANFQSLIVPSKFMPVVVG